MLYSGHPLYCMVSHPVYCTYHTLYVLRTCTTTTPYTGCAPNPLYSTPVHSGVLQCVHMYPLPTPCTTLCTHPYPVLYHLLHCTVSCPTYTLYRYLHTHGTAYYIHTDTTPTLYTACALITHTTSDDTLHPTCTHNH